ncbi:hypothetical protein DDZ14_02815 [Maritimibacter sp. 55A14]|nr:hypothetical protein DDZ14_02815 [Maritimibacter sp. 55A14]
MDQVVSVIGPPDSRDGSKAIWTYERISTNRVPVQHYINGRYVTIGFRTERIRYHCTYTAALNAGRIASSQYDGNNCYPFAPKLPT